MATNATNRLVAHLRRIVLLDGAKAPTDAALLTRFIETKDESAFETLMHRHGPMVLGVCRRLLPNSQDADDAFQATFLVLVRKAATIRPREMVGNWLYGVAHQTAIRARSQNIKRRGREKQVTKMPDPQEAFTSGRADWHDVLDQELSRLPDKYRAVIVLCDLEGKTRSEAARQLGWPEGSVAGRLARGRAMLAKRLAKHGPPLSVGTLAAGLSQNVAAALPAALASSTVQAAAAVAAGQAATGAVSVKVASLMNGVLKAMLLTKLKTGSVLLLTIGLVCGGVGGLSDLTTAVAQTQADKKAVTPRDDAELQRATDDFEAAKEKLRHAQKIHDEAREQVFEAHERLEFEKQKRRPIEGVLQQVNATDSSIELFFFKRSKDQKKASLLYQLGDRGPLNRDEFFPGSKRATTSYRVNKDAVIVKDLTKARLADLKTETIAFVTLDADGTNAVKIVTDGGMTVGQFMSADSTRNTIAVSFDPEKLSLGSGQTPRKFTSYEDVKEKTYKLMKETEILTADGKAARREDLKEGMILFLTRSQVDRDTVIRIQVASTAPPEVENAAPPSKEREPNQDKKPAAEGDTKIPERDLKIRQAFGNDCEELKRSSKVYFAAKDAVAAFDTFEIEPDGRLKLTPFSVGLFQKSKEEQRLPEVTTAQCKVAFLTLDRKVNKLADLSLSKVVAVELGDDRGVTIRINRNAQELNDGLELKIKGKLYFDGPSLDQIVQSRLRFALGANP